MATRPAKVIGVNLLSSDSKGSHGIELVLLDIGLPDGSVTSLYVPFTLPELLTCMRSILGMRTHPSGQVRSPYTFNDIHIDLQTQCMPRSGARAELTPHEYSLLSRQVESAGQEVKGTQLLTKVLGPSHAGLKEALRLCMAPIAVQAESRPY